MKWEYKYIDLEGDDWEARLNEEGIKGWELVAVHHFFGNNLLAFFKRPRS